MNTVNRIFVVGHPGVGKGLFAQSIAKAIGWDYVDADLGIEHRDGLSLDRILGDGGKVNFGKVQCHMIHSLLNKEYVVVATDGAVLDTEDARDLLQDEYVIYLNTSAKTQLERLTRNPDPLIGSTSYEALLNELHQLRDDIFKQISAQQIDGNHNDIESQVSEVIKAIGCNEKPDSNRLISKEKMLFHAKTHEPVELTDQQALCLRYLVKGFTSKEIGQQLEISYRTVEVHLSTLKEKLGCSSSKELVALYHM